MSRSVEESLPASGIRFRSSSNDTEAKKYRLLKPNLGDASLSGDSGETILDNPLEGQDDGSQSSIQRLRQVICLGGDLV